MEEGNGMETVLFDPLQYHHMGRHQQQQNQHAHIGYAHAHAHAQQPSSSHAHAHAHAQAQHDALKSKSPISEDDERSYTEEGSDASGLGKKGGSSSSPWHRMKWTDSMVKLLIAAVMYIGEDGEPSPAEGLNKRKAGLLQKKGKWKSVSRVMMGRGCYVSPQQCEDKFNDLNKRYKRLNDVLGRGTACRVVENPTLLDGMDNLSPKMKEDVRKILSSKHLFYREMCAYHNGNRIHVDDDHGMVMMPVITGGERERNDGLHPVIEKGGDDDDDGEEDDDEDEDDDNDFEHDEELDMGGGSGGFGKRQKMSAGHGMRYGCVKEDDKSNGQYMFNQEMMGIFQDGEKSNWQKRQWIKAKAVQLEAESIELHAQAFDLEKQHVKWKWYSRKKEREFDRLKLENGKMRLSNKRMKLQLLKKELELEPRRPEVAVPSHGAFDMPSNHHANERFDIHGEDKFR